MELEATSGQESHGKPSGIDRRSFHGGADVNEKFWRELEVASDKASSPLDDRMAEIAALPSMSSTGELCWTNNAQKIGKDHQYAACNEVWAVSYSELRNCFSITMSISHTGASHDGMIICGRSFPGATRSPPSVKYVIAALWSAMMEPEDSSMTGPAHRPNQLLITRPLHDIFEGVETAMRLAGISCFLDHYDNDNKTTKETYTLGKTERYSGSITSRCCAGCGADDFVTFTKLKLCAKCRSVWYCCRECQVKNWSSHKHMCKLKAKQISTHAQAIPVSV